MAQLGSALALGARGRRFKSGYPDFVPLTSGNSGQRHGLFVVRRSVTPQLDSLSMATAPLHCAVGDKIGPTWASLIE